MRTRRIATVLAVAVLVPLLSGCALLAHLPGATTEPEEPVGPLGIGSCLDGMIGADSDRDAVVSCEVPHLFEVTAVEEWPGMEDLLADASGADAAWYDVPDDEGYIDWSSKACMQAAQRMIGIADVAVGDLEAGDMWLRVMGPYNVDMSLASRQAFVDGDHRTVCSLAWYFDNQTPQRSDGSFADLMKPGVDSDRRECWDSDTYVVPCARPHAIQAMLGFDGLIAFGDDLVKRVADGDASDDDWTTVDDFCEEVLYQALPATSNPDNLYYYGETAFGTGWDEYEDTIDPDLPYPFACLLLPEEDGQLLTGDVFDGDAAVDPASGSGNA